MIAHTNFLSEPSALALDLPDTVDPVPDLVGVVALDGGARAVLFEPSSRRHDPSTDPGLSHLFDIAQSAHTVSVYKDQSQPTLIMAFWVLRKGWLSTFVQDQIGCGSDLIAGIRAIVANLDVQETGYGLPYIVVRPPLTLGDIRDPLQREAIIFTPQTGVKWPDVTVERVPTWATGRRRLEHLGKVVKASKASSATHTDVQVVGPAAQSADVEALADQISNSVVPSG